ncbi:hypothetical protein B7463_g1066, partial [Scytalidium lignicola]
MASPAVSTPSSAGSPAAFAQAPPALAIKAINNPNMVTIAPASGLPTPTIVTTKEWVIPPRPKPGRKPATDTPPTKRKAQNRAAQRAFRERRAARVGELEEQLEEFREEQQRRETDLRDKISKLETEVLRFSGEVQSWKLRCDTLDRIVEYERSEKESALAELAYLRNGSRSTGTDAVPLPPRRGKQGQTTHQPDQYVLNQSTPTVEEHLGCGNCTSTSSCACVEQAMEITTAGCGNCTNDSHCQCLEDTLKDVTTVLSPSTDLKRPISPAMDDPPDKRRRQSMDGPLEIDFTMQFSSKHLADQVRPSLESTVQVTDRRPAESCGFCEEGTYCMCAEAATVREREHQNRLAPLLNEVTPPPSDTDLDNTVTKLPSMQPRTMHKPVNAPVNSCINGPGTCKQCQNDPKSGLFCRSLSALVSASGSSTPDGCCRGNANGGGCCKSQNSSQTSHAPPTLSFADTYKTLSSHNNFDQASDELNTWLGRLHATAPQHPGRAPMEVEAASVMGVLKLFDRRFGRS